jgi:hypothetical protein
MSEVTKPLLMDELGTGEKVLLANLSLHPGYKILEKLFSAACTQATQDVIKLDPMADEYPRKIVYLQQAARTVNRYTSLVLKSVIYHSEMGKAETEVAELDLEARVNQAEREIAAGS